MYNEQQIWIIEVSKKSVFPVSFNLDFFQGKLCLFENRQLLVKCHSIIGLEE